MSAESSGACGRCGFPADADGECEGCDDPGNTCILCDSEWCAQCWDGEEHAEQCPPDKRAEQIAPPEAQSESPPQVTDAWVVLHVPTDTWWRPQRSGYCRDLLGAGVYTEAEAKQCEVTRSPLPNGSREDKAMPLSEALRGLQPATVGAMLGLDDREQG